MYKYSKTSKDRLDTCHHLIQWVFYQAIKETPVDFGIACGHRTEEEQNKAFEEGYSKVKFPNSAHNSNPSRAVDIYPWIGGKADWENRAAYRAIAEAILETADKLGVKLFWGYDRWGWDMPHFELEE